MNLEYSTLSNTSEETIELVSTEAPAVAIITNFIDENHRTLVLNRHGFLEPGVFSPVKFEYKGNTAHVYFLDMLPHDIFSIQKAKEAKENFKKALNYASASGIRVALLAASTKRLFGNGKELRELFPEMTFTIGDNGTALSFLTQIDFLSNKIDKVKPVVVLGSGFLGNAAIAHLSSKGFEKIIAISKHKPKEENAAVYYTSLDEYIASDDFDKVSLFLGCAHNHDVQTEQLNALIEDKLHIIDVAVPKSITPSIVEPLKEKVVRFDGGNYEIKNLDFPNFEDVGVSYQGELYGCFTEAFLLGMGGNKNKANFFEVNQENMGTIKALIQSHDTDFRADMKNFGTPVTDFPSSICI